MEGIIEELKNSKLEHKILINWADRVYTPKYEQYFIKTKQEAYNYSNRYGRLPMFSRDKSDTDASKDYHVASYHTFWMKYQKYERCYYEVILPEFPCHLYLDIEGQTLYNDDVNFEELYVALVNELKSFISIMHYVPQQEMSLSFLCELDSSNKDKFSRHVIIHFPSCMFLNNYYCGALIRRFFSHILCKYGSKNNNPFFVWHGKDNETKTKIFFLDMGVYTHGRDFRLYGSHKRSNGGHRTMWIKGKGRMLNINQYKASLVQFIEDRTKIKYLLSTISDPLTGGLPISSSMRRISPVKGNVATVDMRVKYAQYKQVYDERRSKISKPSKSQLGILNRVGKYMQNLTEIPITKVVWKGETLFFQTESQECEIKRQLTGDALHHSNKIYFYVNLKSNIIYQSCFNNTHCYNSKVHRHRRVEFGQIDDIELLKELYSLILYDDFIPFVEDSE